MNLILLFENDFIDNGRHVRLTDRRHQHIRAILKVKLDEELCVGLANGKTGTGRVVKIDEQSVELDVQLTQDPPLALPLTLILALPRPQVINRTLICASSLGIKKIILLNFYRVEKSLWQSSSLREDAIRKNLILGLEQAKDTRLPEVLLRKRFKIFVEDELPEVMKGTLPLVAHPGARQACPKDVHRPVTLVIGPEGGLTDYEVEKLTALGFQDIDLGSRILRVESVLPFVAGRMF